MVGPHLSSIYKSLLWVYQPTFATEDLYLVLQNSGITRLSKLTGLLTATLGYLTVLLEYLNLSGHITDSEMLILYTVLKGQCDSTKLFKFYYDFTGREIITIHNFQFIQSVSMTNGAI